MSCYLMRTATAREAFKSERGQALTKQVERLEKNFVEKTNKMQEYFKVNIQSSKNLGNRLNLFKSNFERFWVGLIAGTDSLTPKI